MIILTLALLLIVGHGVRESGRRLHIPPAISLIALGLLLGPWLGPGETFEWPKPWRSTLSQMAFAVLLVRAGLALPRAGVGRLWTGAGFGALLPALAESGAVACLLKALLFDEWALCFLGAAIVTSPSPAVVLPSMLGLREQSRGKHRLLPEQMILQIIISAFLATSAIFALTAQLANDPSSWVLRPLGAVAGWCLGVGLGWVLHRAASWGQFGPIPFPVLAAFLGTVGIAVFFGAGRIHAEAVFATVGFAWGATHHASRARSDQTRRALESSWKVGEIYLFVSVGSLIDLTRLHSFWAVAAPVLIIAVGVVARLLVAQALGRVQGWPLPERRVLMAANVPKATVQAVYGAYPLLEFQAAAPHLVEDGERLLILAALAIVTTAPVGATLLGQRIRQLISGQ